MPDQKCNVCGSLERVSVRCSAMGAVSFGYCEDCRDSNREPWTALVGGLFGVPRDDVAPWVKPIIAATLQHYGKTEDELWKDVENLSHEYEQAEQRSQLREWLDAIEQGGLSDVMEQIINQDAIEPILRLAISALEEPSN